MLSRRQFSQPPRRFESVDHSLSSKTLCSLCSDEIFNSVFYQELADSKDDSTFTKRYSRVSSNVYRSMLDGCRWCSSIGNAVLTSVDLDYWMNDWHGSHSDGASLMDDEGGSLDGEDGLAKPTATSEHDWDVMEKSDGDGRSQDNSPSDAADMPGFLTMRALDCEATLEMTVEFLKYGGSCIFNLLRIMVEVVSSNQEEGTLPQMAADDAVHIIFEVISSDMIPQVFPRRWGVVSAAAGEWTAQAKDWMQSCCGHKCSAYQENFWPTRLIDVSIPHTPRLVTRPQGGSCHPYAVLSYVWGLGQSYILTTSSMNEMHTALDSSRLPKTILNAIDVACQMGLNYLWVDALCIVQDLPEDKARELPRMADVYRQSSISIVAASASAATEGFLSEPSQANFFVDPFSIELKTGDGPPTSLTLGYRQPYKASGDPINTRAWTLQERVLSPRLLIFSRSGCMWMCRECYINPGAAPDAGPPYLTFLGPDTGDGKADADYYREQWMAIRADYTEMDLTFCIDKLPAISALAAEVARRTGWTYLAGLWKENLFSELHWRSMKKDHSGNAFLLKQKKVRDAGYLAPSWSWASVGLGMIVDSEDESEDREVFDFEILKCQVDLAGDQKFQFGPVNGGFIEVKGKVVELTWRLEDRPEWDGSDVALLDGSNPEQTYVVGDGTLDPLDENIPANTKIYCLGMSKLRLGRQRIVPVEGLMLLPTGSGGSFHRIGFCRITCPSIFDGVPSSQWRIE